MLHGGSRVVLLFDEVDGAIFLLVPRAEYSDAFFDGVIEPTFAQRTDIHLGPPMRTSSIYFLDVSLAVTKLVKFDNSSVVFPDVKLLRETLSMEGQFECAHLL